MKEFTIFPYIFIALSLVLLNCIPFSFANNIFVLKHKNTSEETHNTIYSVKETSSHVEERKNSISPLVDNALTNNHRSQDSCKIISLNEPMVQEFKDSISSVVLLIEQTQNSINGSQEQISNMEKKIQTEFSNIEETVIQQTKKLEEIVIGQVSNVNQNILRTIIENNSIQFQTSLEHFKSEMEINIGKQILNLSKDNRIKMVEMEGIVEHMQQTIDVSISKAFSNMVHLFKTNSIKMLEIENKIDIIQQTLNISISQVSKLDTMIQTMKDKALVSQISSECLTTPSTETIRKIEESITCEHALLNFGCSIENQTLNIINANYGRTEGATVCPHNGIENNNCFASNSKSIIVDRCQGKSSCSISASNNIFGDPCVGTVKYLKVQFECI